MNEHLLDVSFAELHAPLFLAGKNLGMKLDSGRHGGLVLIYDRTEKELLVTWGGKTAIVPSSSVLSMTEGQAEDRKITQIHHPMIASAPITAQVETPFGHVHAGPGKGKTK